MARKPKAEISETPKPEEEVVISVKGFGLDWKCRDFQFEVGKTYEIDGEIKACERGFHAIEGHPLEVFVYYAAATSRYAIVRQSGALSREADDSKVASAKITIEAELKVPELVKRTWDWVWSRAKLEDGSSATGNRGAASATGDLGAASATGNQGAASATGNQGAASATGDLGAASATGYLGAASATGNQGAASATGDLGAASATGNQGAASATGNQGAASATGNRGAASATGYRGAASATGYLGAASATGNQGAASATGNQGAAMSSGHNGKAMGADGCAIFLVYRDDDWSIVHAWAGIVGKAGIKPGQFYTLDADGKPVECAA
jgi:hypothetical protein